MKISHEVPICLFNESLSFNDYDYCLVHLLKNEVYNNFFKRSLKNGRCVLLDNSVFELDTPFNSESFVQEIINLQPTEYIVPDELENCEKTITNMENWNKSFNDIKGIKIGVVQGKTYKEIVDCYKFMNSCCDKIAISFNYSLYENVIKNESKLYSWMYGRQLILQKLYDEDIINVNKPHHLLGVALPQEIKYYKNFNWIDSIDTSNPIVCGIYYKTYTDEGMNEKPSKKLAELIDTDINNEQLRCIMYNVNKFKEYING